MATNVKFSESLQPALLRAKSECLNNVSSGDGIRRANSFFRELHSAAEILEDKYCNRSRFGNVQRLLPSRGMVARSLRKIHVKIIRHLHIRPKLANPWLGEFTMDIPSEVFTSMAQDIMGRTNFGHEFSETNAYLIYNIIDLRKAKYLFSRMDIDGAEVDMSNILKKEMQAPERCQVIVTEEKPLVLKFHKQNDVLLVKFHYGYWNTFGVPQH